jgi:hypothetical protein
MRIKKNFLSLCVCEGKNSVRKNYSATISPRATRHIRRAACDLVSRDICNATRATHGHTEKNDFSTLREKSINEFVLFVFVGTGKIKV